MTDNTATTSEAAGTGARGTGDGAAAEFERLYRANVEAVTAYFARRITTGTSVSPDGSVTVNAQGIPAGDILVIGMENSGHTRLGVGIITSPPAPSCVSAPPPPPGNGGSGS